MTTTTIEERARVLTIGLQVGAGDGDTHYLRTPTVAELVAFAHRERAAALQEAAKLKFDGAFREGELSIILTAERWRGKILDLADAEERLASNV